MSIILNIDTSLETASVSLASNGEIVALQINGVQKEHASFVHIAVQSLLAKEHLLAKDLAAIVVTIGPGSYTGLRVGLAAALGLCYALSIPLITVGTLEMMAKDAIVNEANTIDGLYCPLIDARRMEVFTAIYNANMLELIAANAQILNPQSFVEFFGQKKIIFFGSGMEKWKSISTNKNAFFCTNKNLPNALNILGYEKFISKNFTVLTKATPLYGKAFYNP